MYIQLSVRNRRRHRAFTLVEMVCTLSAVALLSALSVSTLGGVVKSTALQIGAREFAQHIDLARSEAITRHRLIRFCVAREWRNDPSQNRQKYSLWEWNDETEKFAQISAWKTLPEGVVLETETPSYLSDAGYAEADATAIRGLGGIDPTTEASFLSEDETIEMSVLEFLPSGTARIPGVTGRQVLFVLAPGVISDGENIHYLNTGAKGSTQTPTNWAQVNVDLLTGNTRIHRP